MTQLPLATPGFGQADLSNCEREQIQFAASIQPHGVLLVLDQDRRTVIQASENARAFLKLLRDPVGSDIADLDHRLADALAPHLANPPDIIPVAVRCHIGSAGGLFDGLVHRPADGGLIIELEAAGAALQLPQPIEQALQAISSAPSIRALAEATAAIFKDLTGYDRVMVYRFDDEGHGEVFSERREPHLEVYLGNRYPASDIPQIARRLYERNRIRVLVDVAYRPVPLRPRVLPTTGRDLDMSLCVLRSMSPIHIQYLKNMGVGATLVASLVVGGRLWGLVACHHYAPRHAHFELRSACEVVAEAVATRIAALESFAKARAELSVRRLEQRLVEAISRDGDWRGALLDNPAMLLEPLGAAGAALLLEGQLWTIGEAPGAPDLRRLADWLDRRPRNTLIATASLGMDDPDFADLKPVASGLVAAPISTGSGEYLFWFRPERVRTVTWGGDPRKAVIVGDSPSDLSPRRSFAQWHQLVEGTSDPWTPADLTAARMIADTLADMVLQFRSVRMLIAKEQLDQVTRQVRASDNPVIVADDRGRILLANEALRKLLPENVPPLERIEDLTSYLEDAAEAGGQLRNVLRQAIGWRGEVRLWTANGEARTLLVRADPVNATSDRVLGFVFLFTDVTQQKNVETARRRFQQDILERYDGMNVRIDSKEDIEFRNLMSAVVENAQLAALEIADSVETERILQMLESIRTSVDRSAELLEHLIWHARGGGGRKGS